jgi:hypothetical protein
LSRQETFIRLGAIRAVADWNRRVIAAVIGVHKFIASVCYIKIQHPAHSRTDRYERVIARVRDKQGAISLQLNPRRLSKGIRPRENAGRPHALTKMSRPYRGTRDADNESQQCEKEPPGIFHSIPFLREVAKAALQLRRAISIQAEGNKDT